MFIPNSVSKGRSGAQRNAVVSKVTGWVETRLSSFCGLISPSSSCDEHTGQDFCIPSVKNDFNVMVREIQCSEPDCVPIETLIIVVSCVSEDEHRNLTPSRWAEKVLKPIAEVTQADIDTLAFPPEWRMFSFGMALDSLVERFLRPVPQEESEKEETRRNDMAQILQQKASLLEAYYNDGEIMEIGPVPTDLSTSSTRTVTLSTADTSVGVTIVKMKPLVSNSTEGQERALAHGAIAGADESALEATSGVTVVHMVPTNSSSGASTETTSTARHTEVSHGELSDPPTVIDNEVTSAIDLTKGNNNSLSASSTSKGVSTAVSMVALVSGEADGVAATEAAEAARDAKRRSLGAAVAAQKQVERATVIASRHGKESAGGTRPRGCPCCDPDNLDNVIDNLMFMHYPQN